MIIEIEYSSAVSECLDHRHLFLLQYVGVCFWGVLLLRDTDTKDSGRIDKEGKRLSI